MNLVTTHYNCTSPIDYISHHALHTHIPVHHYTNHTAVTIHSLVLIASPHLHLILTLTFKQHSHLHSLRSLVSPWLHFRAYFSVCLSVHYLDCWPPLLIVCCLPLWPRLFHGNPLCLPPALTHCSVSVFDSAFSTLPSTPLPDICLFWPCTNKAASGSTLASDLSSVTEDFAKDESSSKIDVTPPGYKVHWGLCRRLPRTGTPYSLWQHLLNDIFSWGLIWTSSLNHAAAWS